MELAAGTVDRRKGADLFVKAAATVAHAVPDKPVRFLWCGKSTDVAFAQSLAGEIAQLNVEPVVTFLGEMPSPLVAYQAADAFALTSREDPFPLVCLEAAATGLPVVAFRTGGGIPSFVENDAGIVVEQLDPGAFAEALLRLERDSPLRTHLGDRGARKVRERYDVAVAVKTIRGLLKCLHGQATVSDV